MGRVYESKKASREPVEITEAQKEGRAPLQTFGALKALYEATHPSAVAGAPQAAKKPKKPRADRTDLPGGADQSPGDAPPVGEAKASETILEPTEAARLPDGSPSASAGPDAGGESGTPESGA